VVHLFYSSAVACLRRGGHNFSVGKQINPKTFFMKMLTNAATRLVCLILSFVAPLLALAQEGGAKIDVDINKNEGSAWYTNPVVWIIGAAVFILLLVALLRGNNSSRS
jgi:hypothetical protein